MSFYKLFLPFPIVHLRPNPRKTLPPSLQSLLVLDTPKTSTQPPFFIPVNNLPNSTLHHPNFFSPLASPPLGLSLYHRSFVLYFSALLNLTESLLITEQTFPLLLPLFTCSFLSLSSNYFLSHRLTQKILLTGISQETEGTATFNSRVLVFVLKVRSLQWCPICKVRFEYI